MRAKNILISGAGVAGPALAYWLTRYGFAPTIVERASTLRAGGQAVDFRGAAHLFVLEQMDLLDEIRRNESRGGPVSFVNDRGEPLATMAEEMASGDVEILRGDLGRILFDATERSTEYIFGDSISRIDQVDDAVQVRFESGTSRVFDLVIGADGLHSPVRALAFGPESQFIRHCGYYVAIASIGEMASDTNSGTLHSVPGRTVGIVRAGNATRAIFYFASPPLSYDRHDTAQQKEIVAKRFAGVGWKAEQLLSLMRDSRDFYFDSISEIHVPTLSNGRVALIGDAGYGGTIGGMGTGVAIVAAYVLAGELAAARGDHTLAFARYESRVREYAEQCQRGARSVGSFMAPKTRLGIFLRNRMLRLAYLLPGKGMMERIAMQRASNITFGIYPHDLIAAAPPATTPAMQTAHRGESADAPRLRRRA